MIRRSLGFTKMDFSLKALAEQQKFHRDPADPKGAHPEAVLGGCSVVGCFGGWGGLGCFWGSWEKKTAWGVCCCDVLR